MTLSQSILNDKELLTLIENVDPNDSDALDEIDARVMCFVDNINFDTPEWDKRDEYCTYVDNWTFEDPINVIFEKYTRSRDALKSIRPEGWKIHTLQEDNYFDCILFGDKHDHISTEGLGLPTEELAELHVIIQVIQWERDDEYSDD